ncbi:MAG: precorrin-6y C5,15-methyltransferase (decarboxylating) subunit CbiE, partial [Nitrospinae bacterium]|nr:precorrin-6y C5,15-methyltransferase (decarboxylating) subunit CbiE [Nitrospinota bacterium]
MYTNKTGINVIGISPEGVKSLNPDRIREIERAQIVIGEKRYIEYFEYVKGDKILITRDMERLKKLIMENMDENIVPEKRIVILSSGDPNLYGISEFLFQFIPKKYLFIHPNVSSMQLAFASIKETMNDAIILSINEKDINETVEIIRRNNKIGLFTNSRYNPQTIAKLLIAKGIKDFMVYICERIRNEEERVIATDMISLSKRSISHPNVMILIREKGIKRPFLYPIPIPCYPGSQDSETSPNDEIITRPEVRVIILSKMCIKEDSIVWDVWPGYGSLSIETALIAKRGVVFAIENDNNILKYMRENISKFNLENIKVIERLVPEGMRGLPDPDSIFIGEGKGRLDKVIGCCARRLKVGGRVIIKGVTLNTLKDGVDLLERRGFDVEVTSVNISRTKG